MYKPKISTNPFFLLENWKGSTHHLIVVKSSKKKEVEKEIRTSLKSWMNNPEFENIKEKPIDLFIASFVNEQRNKRQDVDNIAKVVLDSIKKSKNLNEPYLINDDSQVIRLLIQKIRKIDFKGYETESLIISFREHDPNKQMILMGLENKND